MTTVTFTQSSYDPEKTLNAGQYTGKVSKTKLVDDPVEGDILQVIWDVEGVTLTDSLKICSPTETKKGFAQRKLRNIAGALGLPEIPEKNAGEKLTYDTAAFDGKTCTLEVGSFLSDKGKKITTIDRYIRIPSEAAAQSHNQTGFMLPEKPESTAEMLDDEIPL